MAIADLSLLDIQASTIGDGTYFIPFRWNVSNQDTRSFSFLSNILGFNPGVPSTSVIGTEISMGYWHGIANNSAGSNQNAVIRHMSSSNWTLGAIGNMFFIVYGGNYRVINWCDGTTIYKNGVSQGLVSNAGTVTNLNSLSVGDRIECNKPYSLYYNGLPGLYGAYAGFSGYSFATRNDRESTTNGNKFYIFCTQDEPDGTGGSFFDVRYTTTSNSNVTSTTNDFDDEWSAAYEEFNTSMVNGRAYFAISNTLMCAWRGRSTGSSLYDSVPMYPLTPEPKFGWYSSGGHILACAGPYQVRDGTTSNYSIRTRTSSTTTTEFSLSSGVEKWARNDSNTGANTGGTFSGSPAVTFPSSTGSNAQGALFAAESQGDGDGTEMTPHVGSNAASTYHCNPGGGNWQVHMSLFTGSEGGGVVQRFNSSRVFQESYALGNSTNGFTNTTSHPFASCRFTSLSAGDVFVTTPARGGRHSQSLAWADMDGSDDDETYLPSGDDMDGFSFTSYTVYYDEEESSFLASSALNACNLEDNTITMYSPSSTLQAGMILYLQNTDITTPLNVITGASARAENGYLKVVDGRDSYSLELGAFSNGRVESVTACVSDRRLKKNITKVGTSPSGINIYKFEYIDPKLYGGGVFEGVMAQEVPKASILGKNGYYSVDYSKLDVTFKRINYSLVG